MKQPPKKWGPGIPKYSKEDILEGLELHAFCTNILGQYMQNEGYTIEGVILDRSPTQVIATKKGQRYAAIAAGNIFPFEGRISFKMKKDFADFCLKQNIVPLFGSVGLMSHDEDRAIAGLALKYDGYNIKCTGTEDLSHLTYPVPGDEDYKGYCVDLIRQAYESKRFDSIYHLFADQIEFHSQWVLNPIIGKQPLKDYFDGKGSTLRNSDTKIAGCVVVINKDHKKTGNMVLMSEPGKICALISQTLRGEKHWVLISPDFDENNKICKLCLNDPALFSFVPYYAFQ